MFDAPSADIAEAPPPSAETGADRRARRLEAMAEIGLSLGRKLERQAQIADFTTELIRQNDRDAPQLSRRLATTPGGWLRAAAEAVGARAVHPRSPQPAGPSGARQRPAAQHHPARYQPAQPHYQCQNLW